MAAAATVGRDLHGVHHCSPDVGHRMLVLGYLRGPRPAGVDCERPLRVVCRGCDYTTAWACSGHRESRCRPCSARYRRRVRSVAESGLAAGGRAEPGTAAGLPGRTYLYLLTLTAPGDDVHTYAGGRLVCPCTPAGGVDLASWNASHSGRWNHFRTRLRQAHPSVEFFRGVEVQDRGALHDHALVRSSTPLGVKQLREMAMAAGFGHSVDLAPVVPGSKQCAYYVSKYVTKATDLRDDVPWLGEVVDPETGEVTMAEVPARYRTWSMSREWGSTMAAVRAEAAVYARAKRAALDAAAAAEALSVLTAVLGHVEPVPPAANDP